MAYYSEIIRGSGADVEVIFANNPREILKYTKNVLTCDIHSRARTKRILKESGAQTVCGLDDILNAPVNGSGCNEKYGCWVPINPRRTRLSCSPGTVRIWYWISRLRFCRKTGKHVEVMVYGDGAFKDPVGKDLGAGRPSRVAVANTEGLEGTPNEVKLKYLADDDFRDLSGKR